jgi:hypothetical protein
VNPHIQKALSIESEFGDALGPVTLLNKSANLKRHRQRPILAEPLASAKTIDAVELTYEAYQRAIGLSPTFNQENK